MSKEDSPEKLIVNCECWWRDLKNATAYHRGCLLDENILRYDERTRGDPDIPYRTLKEFSALKNVHILHAAEFREEDFKPIPRRRKKKKPKATPEQISNF